MVSKRPALREPCSLNELISDVVEITRSQMMEKKIQVREVLAPDLPLVEAARVELQQALLNLVVNAMHAMEGTPIDDRLMEIGTRAEAGFVVVSMRDRGHGIPPERMTKVFDPFFSTKRNGLGMGLSICRRIIESHLGQIEACNHDDGGASFTFRLPVRADA